MCANVLLLEENDILALNLDVNDLLAVRERKKGVTEGHRKEKERSE